MKATFTMLNLPVNFEVSIMNTGCCGMAGSFGYEFPELSKKIAERTMLPVLKDVPKSSSIIATGSSCRMQIRELAGRPTFHPAEILARRLIN